MTPTPEQRMRGKQLADAIRQLLRGGVPENPSPEEVCANFLAHERQLTLARIGENEREDVWIKEKY